MDVERILPYEKIAAASIPTSQKWLIENLWLQSACGILGGQPKCCKTWMGLECAVSISSATPCLGRFQVFDPGPSLVYLAEDSPAQVRLRVEGICRSRGLIIDDLDMSIITAPALRLDTEADQEKLMRTIEKIKPRFLLLDPLVRLHRLDENNAREISGLLGFLRELERSHHVSIMLTHHASKRSSPRPGQSLRGSSDLHAFGDSNLYLSRSAHDITLTIEHRSAASIEPLTLQLSDIESMPHLVIRNSYPKAEIKENDITSRIVNALKDSATLTRSQLRAQLRINNQRLGQAITDLQASGTITQSPQGLQLSV